MKSWKIILIGNLMVNIPVILALLSMIILPVLIYGNSVIVPATLVSSFIVWYLWAYLLERWRLWGVENNIAPERMFKMGKYGLINFYRYRIIKEEQESGK